LSGCPDATYVRGGGDDHDVRREPLCRVLTTEGIVDARFPFGEVHNTDHAAVGTLLC
jgi:hypothetical protein